MPRTAASGSGSPTPAACESSRRRCSCISLSGSMRTWASSPKPVLTPYTTSPPASARSIASRPCLTRVRAARASSQGRWSWTTRPKLSRVSEVPSMVRERGMARLGSIQTLAALLAPGRVDPHQAGNRHHHGKHQEGGAERGGVGEAPDERRRGYVAKEVDDQDV